MPRRRRRSRPGLALGRVLTVGTVLALGTAGVVVALNLTAAPPPPPPIRCAAGLDGTDWYLSPEQADNAALITAVAVQRGLPARAATIAIATALQESKLINVGYGDRDSLGLFQQRPSQGWGTREQVMDPVHATNSFYNALTKIDGYQGLEITVAAQRVQRSAFPEAYADHETQARAWASALSGYSPAAVTCTLPALPAAPTASERASWRERALRDWGQIEVTSEAGGWMADVSSALWAVADPARAAWAVAQWSVAVAGVEHVSAVEVTGHRWSRQTGAWSTTPDGTVPAGSVRVTLG